jgi:N-ethylmaleimide reductase
MKLLEKIQLGSVSLKNRIAIEAMTRGRTDSNGLVGGMTVEYYTQRAGAGLQFSEAIRKPYPILYWSLLSSSHLNINTN